MNEIPINIYLRPEDEIDGFPDSLYGDMTVIPGFRSEIQWLYYLMLKDDFDGVHLSREYPEEGVMFIHKANVDRFVWNPNLFVVSLQWDYSRDDRAQLHLVSNYYKITKASLGWLDRLSFVGLQCLAADVLHPVVTPRNPERGDLFENLVYMGDPKNLDEAFQNEYFRDELNKLGMKFLLITDPDLHPDYSNIDVVLAVRKIGKVIVSKPSAKLINAWRAGVPALLGCEQGYRERRKSEYDYIEVDSVEEVLDALRRLKTDVEYRNQIISASKGRGEKFTGEEQHRQLVQFVEDIVLPAYLRWQRKSTLGKYVFLSARWLRYQIRLAVSFVGHRIFKLRAKQYH